MRTIEITGRAAMREHVEGGLELRAHGDPTGAVDHRITVDEAEAILAEDPALVYVRRELDEAQS